ncbi:TBC1 domain family member 25-like [Acipenser oxyrinchus oxyrinchus]|uniref:TBC1 domain family member 25-like n=1 Tax=Acipenser oxyrinchus oxyrinchus TaxID=40147 RepID=A0AAD8CIZ6_ACIOX|nr:TBC1 domain family member 25-like [Acipenser oxyrinchus oxyrinchus]
MAAEEVREVVRVRVKKCEGFQQPELRSFAVDPQITSLDVLQHILIRAFDLNEKRNFGISYLSRDRQGVELYLSLLSDWDLDAAFLSASKPYLQLKIDIKPAEDSPLLEDWDIISPKDVIGTDLLPGERKSLAAAALPFTQSLLSQVGRTLSRVQQALSWSYGEDVKPFKPPLSDAEFHSYLNHQGQLTRPEDLRLRIYHGGVEPSLRKVVWLPAERTLDGLTGQERMDYMKRKTREYEQLKGEWSQRASPEDLEFIRGNVLKDVLRTDRTHPYYAGSEDSPHLTALTDLLTTYAITHPQVSYCQGMSDLASPILAVMDNEAHAFICFCGLMKRLEGNFRPDGSLMSLKFQHLKLLLRHSDPEFYAYLVSRGADDLFFCYRWLLLELKREFAFEDALRMLEVTWSSLPPDPPETEVELLGPALEEGEREREDSGEERRERHMVRPTVQGEGEEREGLREGRELRKERRERHLLSSTPQGEGEGEGEVDREERRERREKHMQRPTAHGEGEERKSGETSDGDEREDTGEERMERCKDESGEEWKKKHLFRPADQGDRDGDRWEEKERNERVMLRPTTPVEGEESEREGRAETLRLRPASQHEREEGEGEREEMETRQREDDRMEREERKEGTITGDSRERMLRPCQDEEERERQRKGESELVEKERRHTERPNTQGEGEEDESGVRIEIEARVTERREGLRWNNRGVREGGGDPEENPSEEAERAGNVGREEHKPSPKENPSAELDGVIPRPVEDSFAVKAEGGRQASTGEGLLIEEQNKVEGEGEVGHSVLPLTPLGKQSSFGEYKYYSAWNESFDLEEKTSLKNLDNVINLINVLNSRVDETSQAPSPSVLSRHPTEESEGELGEGEREPLIKLPNQLPPSHPLPVSNVSRRTTSPSGRVGSPSLPNGKPASPLLANGKLASPLLANGKVGSPCLCGDRERGERPVSPCLPNWRTASFSLPNRKSPSAPTGRRNSTYSPFFLSLPVQQTTFPSVPNKTSTPATRRARFGRQQKEDKQQPPVSLPPPQEFGKGNPFMLFLCLSILLEHRDHIVKNGLDYNELAMHFDRLVRKHNLNRVLHRAKALFADYLHSEVWDSEEGDEASSDSPAPQSPSQPFS